MVFTLALMVASILLGLFVAALILSAVEIVSTVRRRIS
jgi:hypothetical protein